MQTERLMCADLHINIYVDDPLSPIWNVRFLISRLQLCVSGDGVGVGVCR